MSSETGSPYLRGHPSQAKVQPLAGHKAVSLFLSYSKTPSIGPAPVIQPMTSHSAMKHSNAIPVTINKTILEFGVFLNCNLRHSKHYLTLTVIIYSISTTRPYTLHPISMHDHLHHNKTPHTIKHIKLEDPTFTSPLHSHFKCRHAMLLPTKSC